jgi:hypothetical protein
VVINFSLSREQRIASIATRLTGRSDDEIMILDWILEGQEDGDAVYGHFEAKTDQRDQRLEAAKEFRDAFTYLGGDFIKAQLRRLKRVDCVRKDEEFADDKTPIEATFEVRDGQLFEIVGAGEVLP